MSKARFTRHSLRAAAKSPVARSIGCPLISPRRHNEFEAITAPIVCHDMVACASRGERWISAVRSAHISCTSKAHDDLLIVACFTHDFRKVGVKGLLQLLVSSVRWMEFEAEWMDFSCFSSQKAVVSFREWCPTSS
jgi:hypothetical protein